MDGKLYENDELSNKADNTKSYQDAIATLRSMKQSNKDINKVTESIADR